ncbi:hypothetical protein ACFWH7_04520 [Cellulosimicrobium cellulans]|uniref:hypothetical protein n=1 Tax=Cellulosimicrobium cellulans TaxID=1710 RepID=UPI00364D201A
MDANWAAVWVAVGAGVISLGSVIVAIVAVAYSRGQRDASERQADAAEAQVEFMRRQVELMERPVPAAPASAPRAAPARGAPYVSPWSVRSAGKYAFVLVNGGTEPAFDVSLSFDVDPARAEPTSWDRLDPRASAKVSIFRAMGASPDSVTVHWRRSPDGELMEWTTALL